MSASLLPNGKQSFFDANGNPLAGGLVYFYVPSTTTPKDTWQDSGETILNTNPVILDAAGQALIYGEGTYRQIVKDRDGNLIWDQLVASTADAAAGELAATALQPSNGQISYATFATLASAHVPSSVRSAYVQGFYVAGDRGASLYQWVASEPTTPGKVQSADGAWWQLAEATPTPYMFGAKGDNTATDVQAFQDWGDFCGLTSRGGHIDRGQYVLPQILTWMRAFDVTSDHTAIMRWTNSASCGMQVDLRQFPANPFTMSFPCLLSPAIDSSFNIPGYSASSGWAYDVNSRVGDAINILGSSRYNIYIHNAQGWKSAFHPEATNDGTYGSRSVANIELIANTIDFCERCFWLDSSTAGSGGVVAFNCYANTVWAKFPIYIDTGTDFVGAGGTIRIGGQCFLNEVGACAIYANGAPSGFIVDLAFVSAGHAGDSPAGTPTNLVCPYLGGNATSNGVSTDGNSSIGYYQGYRCDLDIGAVMSFPLQLSPKIGGFPVAGDPVRVKDAGSYNNINIRFQDQSPDAAIAMSTTQGEGNFNGGIGGAQLAQKILVSCAVPTLSNNTAAVFYFYSQLLSVNAKRPVSITPIDATMGESGLSFAAADRVLVDGVNRQGSVFVSNKTGGSVTGATYFFWLVIENL